LALCATLYQADAMRIINEDMEELDFTFAQTMQDTSVDHTCTFVMDNHKNFENDFYSTVN
jgi:hypothetical protein